MKRILFIDDEEIIRKIVLRILDSDAYIVDVFGNGWEGIQAINLNIPDLVICDIDMPVMDGYVVLEKLRSDPLTATIPFIFLTALSNKSNMRRGMELGADDYLTKPFTRDELINAIKTQEAKQDALGKKFQAQLEKFQKSITKALPHELRTPLTGIMGAASMLKKSEPSLTRERQDQMADIILHSAERLNRLIDNYLKFSELQSMKENPQKIKEIRKRQLALQGGPLEHSKELIESTSTEIAERSGRKADLVLELQEASLHIYEDDLKKIVQELLDNAFKFSLSGTPVKINSKFENKAFNLSVSDHGRGLTQEQIDGVGAYVQFGRDKNEQQGSGLGLAIVKGLVQLYNGELSIESIPGQCTTFKLTFSF